jgi:hypothetical protein
MQYRKWIGNFMWPLFSDPTEFYPYINPHTRDICCCNWICSCQNDNKVNANDSKLIGIIATFPIASPILNTIQEKIDDGTSAEQRMQAMLRDLLYWSIFTNRMDMAKVLILHLRTRICAALSCAAILRNLAEKATTSDQSDRYEKQAEDFEMYATDCINACYLRSQRKACELLIREQPLFGKITCMQVNFVFIDSLSTNMICRWLFRRIVNTSSILIVLDKFSIVFGTTDFCALTNHFLEL